MTKLIQILDQIKNQFPVPVFYGALYPFDRDRFFRALAWLIMHKITFYASLRAVADGAAIHA
jgi:hypothetical protein